MGDAFSVPFILSWFKANKENSHILRNDMSQYYVQRSSSLVLVPEEFPLLQWSTTIKVKLVVTLFDRITRQYFLLMPTDVCVDF